MILPDAADLLARRAVSVRLGTTPGASSFFSNPSAELDPHLFIGDKLQQHTRQWILRTLYEFWAPRYHSPQSWSRVWIAGSGITYQWNAARAVGEPGDLDILIGVDFPTFWQYNPSFHGIGEAAQSEYFNDEFRSVLDLQTDHTDLAGQTYEVTFYVNPGATDIRDINPYAAYDVTNDTWTVRPPDLTPEWDPMRELPAAWWDDFSRDGMQTSNLRGQFNALASGIRMVHPDNPRWINYATELHNVIGQGAKLFDEIHTKRHESFKPDGGGYTGYSNVRWQAGKQGGYLHTLHTLKDLWTSAHANRVVDDCGRVPLDTAHALTIAALVGAQQ